VIELCAFGSLELRQQDGAQILSVLTQPKRAALLCYLALARPHGYHRRDSLVALFWPERDVERARGALRQSLYFLHRSLGEQVVLTRGDEEIGLNPALVWCDVREFERRLEAGELEAALELYRGDLLQGFLLDGASELLEWVARERERLQQQAAGAAWRVALTRECAGEPGAAADWGRRALALAPQNEGAVRQLMELLERIGDRVGAIRVYETFAQRLADELELTPSDATRALVEAMRARDRETASRESPGRPARKSRPAAPLAAEVPEAAGAAQGPRPQSAAGTAPAAPPGSIAVLPFVAMSASPEDAFFSDGLTDEIITTLAKLAGLRVASRTSSFVYKGRQVDIRTVGQELNVASVLEGSVQRAGNRLRVVTQLIETKEGFHLWSAHWDSELTDIFAIEDEIAANVAQVLQTMLSGRGLGQPQPVPRTDVRAYEHYLRGREFFFQTRRRSLHFAREMFQKAIAVDPDYALAHAALAETVALERMYYPGSEVDMPAADRVSLRALALDPTLAQAHSARGSVLFQLERYEEAEIEFRTAQRLDPQLFEAHYFFARMCFQTGRLPEAEAAFERACAVRDDYQAAFFAAQALEALGKHEEAKQHYELGLKAAASHMELNPDDPRAATMRAVACCRVGRPAEGLEWGARAVELDPVDAGVRYNVACLFAVAGRPDDALRYIEEAVRTGFGNRNWLERDPDLDSIRDMPRFRELMASM